MYIGSREFDTSSHTYVMGILNITPDSFSDGGLCSASDTGGVIRRVEEMVSEGADIIDIGGESTRPGYTAVSEDEEMARVLPVIEAVKKNFDIPISLDTYKSSVAAAGIKAGADMINDIWGLKRDPDMAGVIASAGVSCCLMHNRSQDDYVNLIDEVAADLEISVETALGAGIAKDRIILDPGIGFGKSYEDNIQILKNLAAFDKLGYPMLLGASRKSVIGTALGLPTDERLEGTLVTTVLAAQAGYGFVRVHDIKENVRALRMAGIISGRRG